MAVLVALVLNLSTLGAPDYAITVCQSMGVAVTPVILILSGVSHNQPVVPAEGALSQMLPDVAPTEFRVSAPQDCGTSTGHPIAISCCLLQYCAGATRVPAHHHHLKHLYQ